MGGKKSKPSLPHEVSHHISSNPQKKIIYFSITPLNPHSFRNSQKMFSKSVNHIKTDKNMRFYEGKCY